ncbi:MAG TPA: DEAD/DEAH box helicase, partial [Nitrospira sp.]|nr:DEAD/DEAH box helicase [Nitrospira sp.]
EKEADFYRSLIPFMISRERVGVPETELVEIDVHMTPKQSKQYEKFAADAEIKIEEEELSATSVLAEFTRLKQFASAVQRVEIVRKKVGGETKDVPVLHPLPDSGKLDKLMELLDERGILDGSKEHPVVIFSQFKEMVDMVFDILAKKKVAVERITGDITGKGQRRAIVDAFQNGELSVLVMTTTAGGTAITLDRADACIFLDRTWDPDDQYQAWSRISPVTRMVPKTAYFLHSIGTIEDYIRDTNFDKNTITTAVLKGIRLR